jgi:hypothetical protein
MRSPMGQLLLWVVEILDRSMIAVPDVDLSTPTTASWTMALSAKPFDYQRL